MSTIRPLKPWSEAAARLIRAVRVASLEELRSPIEKELGLNNEEILPDLSDHVNDLKLLAMLGYPGAIRSLVSVARGISTFLATLPPHAEECTGDASNSVPAHDNSPKTQKDQWSEINQAAADLYDLVIEHYDSCKAEFHEVQTRLPESRFSFPLEILLGRSEPLDPPLALVADFCDRLLQRRFDSEIKRQMKTQVTGAWDWPVLVSAQDYKGNRRLKDCFPKLNIGESIPINIFSGTVTGTPKELAMSIFIELERERTAPRSKSHIEEFRRDEENNVPAPLKEMIKQAGRNGAAPQYYSGAARSIWDIRNIWIRKAALLPELCAETVSQWVDAAYARAVSVCGGDLEKYEWIDCISDKIRSVGSVDAALRRVITEGFRVIAKD
ncbi:MAG: hypothetical protein KF712_16090 [Akkermansiaceae bacterium]|nr:hypothetical protein [Akkermansiaceae bacterium]